MKRLIAIAVLLSAAGTSLADTYVQGYARSDGTYVQGYMRSSPDSHKYNNYSSEGNSNPYTGEKGTQRNEFSSEPSYNSGRSKPECSYHYNCKD